MPTHPTTLSPADIEHFETEGYVIVRGAFSANDALAMQDEWWSELGDIYGIAGDDRSTWRQPRADLKRAKLADVGDKFETARVCGVIDDLLGPGACLAQSTGVVF